MVSLRNITISKEELQVKVEDFTIVKKCSEEIEWKLDQSFLQELRTIGNHEYVSSGEIKLSNGGWIDLHHGSSTMQLQVWSLAEALGDVGFIDVKFSEENRINPEVESISLKGQNLEMKTTGQHITYSDDKSYAWSEDFRFSVFRNALLGGEVVITINISFHMRHKLERIIGGPVKKLEDMSSEVIVQNLSTENCLEIYEMFSARGLNVYKRQVCKYIVHDMKNVIDEYGLSKISSNFALTADCIVLL